MITKDDIINAIMKFTGGDTSRKFTKNSILNILGKKSSNKTIDKIFKELVNEGVISLATTKGKAKYYVLSKNLKEKEIAKEVRGKTTENVNSDIQNVIREIVDEAIRKYFEEYFGKPKTFQDLDNVYETVKDDIGYASINDIREQLGMSLEQFMSKFRDYILKHYELIAGGKEGFVIHGTRYGIIRKKV
ncbi:hypothetical protein V6M85_07735 [Sulfolobus tengchongensis]|uniref:Uncharacterized protein n=1 Tax=Sulfolobus tengchongensis TaxID=207809 RepID=A0AAX4KYS6_9CREN